jgi:hypothetical protein
MTLTFELTLDEANIMLAALGELPAKASMSLITKLQQQAQGQLPQAAPESDDA